jgi:hypothetical protein
MWRRVDFVWTDVSEERIASTFRVEKSASEEPALAGERERNNKSICCCRGSFGVPKDQDKQLLN